jgi:hypothetical protein
MGNSTSRGMRKLVKYILNVVDPETGCNSDELELTSLDLLPDALRVELSELSEGDAIILNSVEAFEVISALKRIVNSKKNLGRIFCVPDEFVLNFLSHTGKELRLMLEGKKPFAAFSMSPDETANEYPEVFFEKYVRQGVISKVDYLQTESNYSPVKIKYLLYALPKEEWRIESYLMLWRLAGKFGWNSSFEFTEGYLLGYETELDPFFLKEKNEGRAP